MTYTAASVAMAVVPDLRSFFSDLERRVGDYEIRPRVRPEVEDNAEESLGEHSRWGSGAIVAAGAVGLAVGAALAGAIGSVMEQMDARGMLAAQLGGSPQYAAEIGALAGKLYASGMGDSLTEVQDAMRDVVKSGALMEDASDGQISGLTTKVMNLSKAFGVDTTEAARAVATVMRNNLAPDADAAMDVIFRGFQQGVDIGGDFLDTLNEYSPQFAKFGLDAATATGLLSQGLKAGARDSDFVADAIKEFSIRAIDGSKTTAAGFSAIGLNAETMAKQIAQGGPAAKEGLDTVLDRLRGMKDPVQQSQAAVALFGTKAEDLGKSLFALDPSTAVQGLGDVGGAADAAGNAMTTPANQIESFKRTALQGLTDFIGGKLIPALTGAADILKTVFAGIPVPEIMSFLFTVGGTVAGVMLTIAGATKAWSLAQALLNVVMAANPVTLWIIAISAIVGAIIWAYNNVAWFRDGVNVALHAVGGFFTWLWQSVIVPAWNAIVAVISWAWTNIISPVLSAIGLALRILGAVIFVVLVAPFLIAWNIISAIITWAWNSIIRPVLQAIGALFSWLWTNAIKPALDAVGAAFTWVWQNIISPVAQAIMAGLRVLGDGFMAFWRAYVKPALDGVGAVAQWVWNNVLRPAFDGIMGAVHAVGDAFGWCVDRIRDVWGKIQGIVKPPIDFVVNVVYNNGIRPAWNFIADIFGLGKLPEYHFDKGGVVPGSDMGFDTIPAMLRGGEGVLVPEATRMLGGAAGLHSINRLAERQHFADGGVAGGGGFGAFVGGIADFFTDPVGAVKKVFGQIDTGPLRGVGRLSEALLAIPVKVIDAVVAKVKSAVSDMFSSFTGAGGPGALNGWIATAMGIAGVPGTWGGPLHTLIMRESGGNPNAINLWDSNAKAGHPSQGLMQTIPGTFAAYRDPRLPNRITDPIANIVAGINYIKARYGSVFNVQQAVGRSPRGYDNGGFLDPGWNTVYNGLGRPEPVLTPDQWDNVREGGMGGGDTYVINPSAPLDERQLAREVTRRQRFNRRIAV